MLNEENYQKGVKKLKLIADTLLQEETITKEQIDYLVKHGKLPEEETKEKKETKKDEK